MSRILVTGSQGFIGKHLVKALVKDGFSVTALDRNPHKEDIANLHLQQDASKYFLENITKLTLLQNTGIFRDSEKIDTVVHLASSGFSGVPVQNPWSILDNNFETLLTALNFCKVSGARLIFVSSGEDIFEENKNPFSFSKFANEKMIEMFRETYDVKASVVKLFNVYGQGEREYGQNMSTIRLCKHRIWENMYFYLLDDPNTTKDYLHVSDVASGLVYIISGNLSKHVYHLGSGGDLSEEQIVNLFAKGTSLKVDRFPDIKYPLSPHLAEQDLLPLGWKPKVNLTEYINEWKKAGCPYD